jgi:hypothetical protein
LEVSTALAAVLLSLAAGAEAVASALVIAPVPGAAEVALALGVVVCATAAVPSKKLTIRREAFMRNLLRLPFRISARPYRLEAWKVPCSAEAK